MSLVLGRFVRFSDTFRLASRLPLAAAATGSVLHTLALPNGNCGLGVGGCGTHALLDLAGHGKESLLDVGGALCGGLKEGDAEAVCELLCILSDAANLYDIDNVVVPLLRYTRPPSCLPYRTCCPPTAC